LASALPGSTGGSNAPTASSHLTYSNVISTLCLFLLVGDGSAYALSGSNTVFTDDIVNGEVKTPDLANASVASTKLRDNAVGTDKIANGSVQNGDLGSDAVDGTKVADETINGSEVLDGGIGLGDLADNSVNSAKVANNSLSGSDVQQDSLGGLHVLESSLGKVPSASSADFLNGKIAPELEGARRSAIVRGDSCNQQGRCLILRSNRVVYAIRVAPGRYCVGVDGIPATEPKSMAIVSPVSTADAYGYWAWALYEENLVCVGSEYEIYMVREGIGFRDMTFTIVIP
jgi:hypothetical protein